MYTRTFLKRYLKLSLVKNVVQNTKISRIQYTATSFHVALISRFRHNTDDGALLCTEDFLNASASDPLHELSLPWLLFAVRIVCAFIQPTCSEVAGRTLTCS